MEGAWFAEEAEIREPLCSAGSKWRSKRQDEEWGFTYGTMI